MEWMMKQKMFFVVLTALVSLISVPANAGVVMPASAVVFDFAAVADGDASYGAPAGESGAASFTFTKGGLSVTATAAGGFFPYLDDNKAGLGVCKNLNGSAHCAPAKDDNITFDESLMLTFDQMVSIDQTTFVNGRHNPTFNGDFELSIDGGAAMTYALANIFTTPLIGQTFVFTNLNIGADKDDKKQFYINTMDVTPVPVPAAVWLFGTGLLGLARFSRRKA
jgi:hypothetical protein